MLLEDKEIDIIIKPQNRKYYEKIYNKPLKNGESIRIKQKLVQKNSRIIIDCICDFCNKPFSRKRVDIHDGLTFCSNKCRNENLKRNNPNPPKEKILVNCAVCNNEFPVFEYKFKNQDYFLCSRDCYKKHRSLIYNGENLYNYQDIKVECEYCHKEVKVSQFDVESRNHLFCSQGCYWNHRKENYTEFYYSSALNDSRKETKPEELIREWLENNNIKFEQEFGFMGKYYIDFYLYEYKMFLEVYGDYWHSNPKIYGDDINLKPLNEQQVKQKEYDVKRNQNIESHGYEIFIIWENEIYSDINLYMGKISENFNKNPQRLHA